MKNKIISSLVLLITLVCTIIIYHLLFDEHSKLFYINVVTACIVEIILLANIPILSNEKWLTFKSAATTNILNIYAILLFLWTGIYSLCIEEESDYKMLYIGMLAVSIIFIVLLGITELGGNFMQKQEQGIKQTTQKKKILLISLNMYWSDIQDMLQTVTPDWKNDALRKLKASIDKISIIPSKKLEDNIEITADINTKLNDIKEVFNKISKDSENSYLQNEADQKIEQLKNYIVAIKSSL